MCRFLETIKIYQGKRFNLDSHNYRLNHTIQSHYPGEKRIDLKQVLKVPNQFKTGLIKCRVLYTRRIEEIQFHKYLINIPRSFKIVESKLDYHFKKEDRSELKAVYSQRGECEDILILKDGKITDSYYANFVFYKNNIGYTPAEPLLSGTQRHKLILSQKIFPSIITLEDLAEFSHFKIINSMISPSLCPRISMNAIKF